MYKNTYSTDRAKVVRWAHNNAKAGIELWRRFVADSESKLSEQRAYLEAAERSLAVLLECEPLAEASP